MAEVTPQEASIARIESDVALFARRGATAETAIEAARLIESVRTWLVDGGASDAFAESATSRSRGRLDHPGSKALESSETVREVVYKATAQFLDHQESVFVEALEEAGADQGRIDLYTSNALHRREEFRHVFETRQLVPVAEFDFSSFLRSASQTDQPFEL